MKVSPSVSKGGFKREWKISKMGKNWRFRKASGGKAGRKGPEGKTQGGKWV